MNTHSPLGGPPPIPSNQVPSHTQQDPLQTLHNRFPRMKPVKSAPPLFRLNGCGFAMFGSGKIDPQTGTYLKTYGLTLVFIPIFPFTNYRVADAREGGWYFYGREALGGFGRAARLFMILGVISIVMFSKYEAHKNSPVQIVKRELKDAAEVAKSGNPLKAVVMAHDLAKRYSSHADTCFSEMNPYVDACLGSDDPLTTLGIIELIQGSGFRKTRFKERIEPLYALALSRANSLVGTDAAIALKFSAVAQKLDDGATAAWLAPKRAALESLVNRKETIQKEHIDALAQLYDDMGDSKALIALLEPRVPFPSGDPLWMRLGHACIQVGRPAEGSVHLEEFTKINFPIWKKQNATYVKMEEAAYQRALENFNKGLAPASVYKEYEAGDEVKKEEVFGKYAWGFVSQDPSILSKQSELTKIGNLPAYMLDLGIAQIHAGQASAPEVRDEWFRKAEKTFLNLKEHAEESVNFQFFYGQVCYWLGKHDEGAKLFERLIAEHGKDPSLLSEIGTVLREVGNHKKAREVYQKAYDNVGEDKKMRDSLLVSLSILAETTDERISYLEKGDQSNPRMLIDLANARGAKAEEEGDRDAARKLYQKALEGYVGLSENEVTLNNAALIHFRIASLGGGQAEYSSGLRKMEAAIALDPNDSILCYNASENFLKSAADSIVGQEIEPAWMMESRGLSDIRLLYKNEEERKAVLDRLNAHPDYQRGRQLLDRTILLAPENREALSDAISIAALVRDEKALQSLAEKIEILNKDKEKQTLDQWVAEVNALPQPDVTGLLASTDKWHDESVKMFTTPRAKAAINVRRISYYVSMAYWLPNHDFTAFSKLLNEANSTWPSSEFIREKIAMDMLLCWRRICKEKPEVSKWAGESLRMLPANSLLTLAVLQFPDLLEDKELREVFEIELAYSRSYPSTHSPEDAVIAQLLNASDQKAILDVAKGNISNATHLSIARLQGSYSPSTVVYNFWHEWVHEGKEASIKTYKTSSENHPWLPKLR